MSVKLADVPIVSPNVGSMGEQEATIVAPLDNYLCLDCGLSQLIHVVDPALIYSNYLYRTSISKGLNAHFGGLAQAVIDRQALKSDDLVVEIGSNDGTLLKHFKTAGMRVQGVDPALTIAEEASASGVPTLGAFFTQEIAARIASEKGTARAILCNNALANIDDVAEVLRGVRTILAKDGAFVFETQYGAAVFEHTLLDVIYHEHISLFSVKPVVRAFERYGLTVFDAEKIPTKGGSIRIWVRRNDGPQEINPRVAELIQEEEAAGLYDLDVHKAFEARVAGITTRLHLEIAAVRGKGGSVAAYGASVGCAALIHQFSLEDKLDYILDDTPFKERLQGPCYSLPIYRGESTAQRQPDLVIVLAWRYTDAIVKNNKDYLCNGGRFLKPLPDLEEVSG